MLFQNAEERFDSELCALVGVAKTGVLVELS